MAGQELSRGRAGGRVTDEPGFRPETLSTIEGPAPGEECFVCKRRVPYPKRESSPVTLTRSYRVPLDEAEAHGDVLETAAKFLGVYEQPHWVFKCYSLALALVLQDEKLRGFAQRQGA